MSRAEYENKKAELKALYSNTDMPLSKYNELDRQLDEDFRRQFRRPTVKMFTTGSYKSYR